MHRSTSRTRLWLWLALLPAVLAVGVAFVLYDDSVPNPQWRVEADVYAGSLIAVVGIAVSALLVQGIVLWKVGRVTRTRELAEQSLEAEAARRRFIRRLDHELKSPLTALHAAVAGLEQVADSDAHREIASQIESLLVQLKRPLVALRKLATLESREIERLPVEVGPLVERVVAAVEETPQCAGRRLASVGSEDGSDLIVMGDEDLLWILLYNVLDNACRYTDRQDAVRVSVATDDVGERVSIRVTDDGGGIPAADLPYVFEDLFRGSNAGVVEGSGLGLALVRIIAERHGGSVRVASGPNGGTTVTLDLPLEA